MRKFVCLMIAILLVLTMSIPAFAAESGGEATCTHEWAVETTQATCTEAGLKTSTCTLCQSVTTETLPAVGHSWQDVAGEPHKRTCGACGTEETGDHSWGEGQVTTPTTCTTNGEKTYTCSCGATKTEVVPSPGHTYGEWGGDVDNHNRSCTTCQATESGPHKLDSGTVIFEATCKEAGVKVYVCSVCEGGAIEALPKLTTHTYENACDPECDVCGATRETEHKYNQYLSKNYKQHWYACSVCGDQKDLADHYPGPAATEEKDQICLVCNYIMTAKLNHVHDYATKWSGDESGHWYACDGCEDQKDFEVHSYDDLCDPDCNVCGYIAATAHSYDGSWSSDATGHWAACVLCGEISETAEHTPAPQADETEALLCAECGFEIAPAKEHVHEFREAWVIEEDRHWKECECGEKAEEAPHSWGEGTKNKDSTVTYSCTECQAEKTEGEPRAQVSIFLVIALVVLVLACVGIVVVLILMLHSSKKTGAFSK